MMLDVVHVAGNRIGYFRFVTVLMKNELQFRWVHVLHLGLLHGVMNGSLCSFIVGSSPDVVCVVFFGRLSILNGMSKSCSVVGMTLARTSILRSDGSASATNLGCGTVCTIVW